VVQAGVLRGANPVLDPGVRAMPGVETGELPEAGVGGERGVAPPIGLFERVELRTGVRTLAAHDHPRPRRVTGQRTGRQNPADLCQTGSAAVTAVSVDRVCPDPRGDGGDRCPFLPVIAQPTENSQLTDPSRRLRIWVRNSRVQPAVSARTRIGVP